jgi:N,N'-diacetylchitobiose transport system substrate-binding protein
VNVQYQSWDTRAPEVRRCARRGRHARRDRARQLADRQVHGRGRVHHGEPKNFPNGKTWLAGLKASCTYRGKLYCVPYYAGARAVIYRKDCTARSAIKRVPTTYAQFLTDNKKLMKKFGKNRNFSAFYEPGQNWYAATTFVEDYGGHLASSEERQVEGHDRLAAGRQGADHLQVDGPQVSRASKTADEAHPFPSIPFAKGRMPSFIRQRLGVAVRVQPEGWRRAEVLREEDGRLPMPSHIKGRYMPTFLGGSDLGIPSRPQQAARRRLDQGLHEHGLREDHRQGRNIANTTTLANVNAHDPGLAPFAQGVEVQLVRPDVAQLANVENSHLLKQMLTKILTNQKTVAAATHSAAQQITQILNASS